MSAGPVCVSRIGRWKQTDEKIYSYLPDTYFGVRGFRAHTGWLQTLCQVFGVRYIYFKGMTLLFRDANNDEKNKLKKNREEQ